MKSTCCFSLYPSSLAPYPGPGERGKSVRTVGGRKSARCAMSRPSLEGRVRVRVKQPTHPTPDTRRLHENPVQVPAITAPVMEHPQLLTSAAVGNKYHA